MVIMSVEIVDLVEQEHKIDLSYDSWTAAGFAREQILSILNWMMREAIITYYVVTTEGDEGGRQCIESISLWFIQTAPS